MTARRAGRGDNGQMVVLFALCLVTIVAFAGLLVDGGRAWSVRRQAQVAADTASLAAAKSINSGATLATARTAAGALAATNGYPVDLVNCAGVTQAGLGVVVNRPPTSGAHTVALDPTGANDYVEVITTRAMKTTFAGAVGQSCWLVSARAVSSVGTASVAKCSFCSLNPSSDNHTLILNNGAALRVDGDVYVNSTSGGVGPACTTSNWKVCGDGFDVFGAGGTISAKTIAVAGGWETHDGNPTKADSLATGCVLAPDPPSQVAPYLPSNVCIHMPQIPDPLNNPLTPKNIMPVPTAVGPPVAGINGCPAGSLIPTGTALNPVTLTLTTGSATICPGTYYGGIKVTGGTATMSPGVYYIGGGGFSILTTGSVVGTAGVLIYNSSGTGPTTTTPGVDLVGAKTTGFKDPKIAKGGGLTAVPSKNVVANATVVLTFEIERPAITDPLPTGTVTFYDGSNAITGCSAVAVGAGSNSNAVKATCSTSWPSFGSKSLSAVYSSGTPGTVYNQIGDALTLTITSAAQAAAIDIETTGSVQLSGAASGIYKGLVMFQDRTSNLVITLSPGSGSAAACPAGFMTTGVPGGTAPDPCGALGGLQGTIYAPQDDATIKITASGLANLQVIAGTIQINSNADARFAYTPAKFANGGIRLTE